MDAFTFISVCVLIYRILLNYNTLEDASSTYANKSDYDRTCKIVDDNVSRLDKLTNDLSTKASKERLNTVVTDYQQEDILIRGEINATKFNLELSDDFPFDIPENWKWVKIGQLFSYCNGYAYKPSESSKTALRKAYPDFIPAKDSNFLYFMPLNIKNLGTNVK